LVVFLDFDGVLRREGDPKYRINSALRLLFEQTILPFDVQIVISSNWKDAFDLPTIRKCFAPEIAPRIIDRTPTLSGQINDATKWKEIEAWLKQAKPYPQWIAIDDKASEFPTNILPQVILTNPTLGFDNVAATALRRTLQRSMACESPLQAL